VFRQKSLHISCEPPVFAVDWQRQRLLKAVAVYKVILSVPEIWGNHSKIVIITALASFDEVDSIDVNIKAREVLVELEAPIDEQMLVQAVIDEGYYCKVKASYHD
jgi:hypothetical protein